MTAANDSPEPLYVADPAEVAEARRRALETLLPHTLPADAPGAWIRRAIEAELAAEGGHGCSILIPASSM
ncbi:MAG: hypothetical protein RLZ55_668 [Actinomycetota bacterium]|jgi:hypothetical protein